VNVLEDAKLLILELYTDLCGKVSNQQLTRLAEEILNTNHLFLAASGRSDLVIRVFANQLVHLGINVHVIGDVTTPEPKQGDFIFISSESGETQMFSALAEQAKKNHIKIAVSTASPESVLANLADILIVLPGETSKEKDKRYISAIHGPGGCLFERMSFLIYDAMAVCLKKNLQQTSTATQC